MTSATVLGVEATGGDQRRKADEVAAFAVQGDDVPVIGLTAATHRAGSFQDESLEVGELGDGGWLRAPDPARRRRCQGLREGP